MKTLEAGSLPWQEFYRRLTEVVLPRPIALVSTIDGEGRRNLAPFSFFTVVSSNPPCLAFSPQRAGRTGEQKDTLLNIQETGQFVVAVVTENMAGQVNTCSAPLPRGESEFDHAGLTPVSATHVRPALIWESPVNMECELLEIRTYGTEGGAGNLVVGRILCMHLDEGLFDEQGRVLSSRLEAVGRMGGEDWVRTRDIFPMPRPS